MNLGIPERRKRIFKNGHKLKIASNTMNNMHDWHA